MRKSIPPALMAGRPLKKTRERETGGGEIEEEEGKK